jgi:hypothetical protein
MAMLHVAEITGDAQFKKYAADRFGFLAQVAPFFEKLQKEGVTDYQMVKVVHPEALDDAGAVCASMIRGRQAGIEFDSEPLINRYIDYIMHKEYRLADGRWVKEFLRMKSPAGKEVYWLTGEFQNHHAVQDDSDTVALEAGYASLVPCKIDVTDYAYLNRFKQWEIEEQ